MPVGGADRDRLLVEHDPTRRNPATVNIDKPEIYRPIVSLPDHEIVRAVEGDASVVQADDTREEAARQLGLLLYGRGTRV